MMILKTFIQLWIIGLLSLLSSIQARTVSPDDYGYPNVPPLEATIAGSFFKAPSALDYETIEISPLYLEDAEDLELRYYPAIKSKDQQQELVFVFSGIGGDSEGNISNFLSHHIAKRGSHAVIVPSVFTQDFALSFSKTGYVGHMPKDAQDMMHALEWVYKTIQREKNIKFDSVKLAGYSLGALSAAHVAHYSDSNPTSFQFDRVILINSPIDLLHGLRYLDRAEREGTSLNVWRLIFGAFRPLIDVFLHFRKTDFITEEIFIESVRELQGLDELDLKALISRALKSSLSGVVMASQRIHDLKILPRLPNLRDDMRRRTAIYNRRLKAAESVNFEQYVDKFLVRYYQDVLNKKDYNLERINKESSLTAIDEYLKKSNHVFFIHNTDDFLIQDKKEVDYIKKTFGERAYLYPSGGHLGNIWYKSNLDTFLKLMSQNPNNKH